ncbi:MAG: hypothetical protein E7024_06245 [Succinivibrio dextrinosolvens]|jgi:type I restriction enzyme S subunit|nr:hypothetical protein [Succinivibrio dextrinosolvens]
MFGDPLSPQNKWAKIQLGSVTEVGSSKRIFEKEYVNNGVPFYRTKEIVELASGKEITTELFISEDRYKEIKELYGVPQKGDLLISAVGTIGTIWVVDGKHDFYFKDGNLLRVKHTEKYNPLYLKYLLEQLIAMHKNRMASGTAYAALTISELSKMNIFDVPLEVQNRFEVFIKQLDKLKVILEKIDEKFELLKKSRFVEMFGDLLKDDTFPLVKFSECTNSMVKGPFGSDMKKDLYVPKGEDTYKVYAQINAIQKDETLGEYYISKDYFDKKIYRFEVKPKDFIITCDGTLGKVLQLDEKMEKGVISSSLLKVTINEEKLSPVFFETLWSDIMLPHMVHQARNACLVHLPSAKVIGEFEFHLPDLNKQVQFESFIKQLDKLKVDMVSKLLQLV